MQTLVLNKMPDSFWQLVKKNKLEEYFTDAKILFSEDIEVFVIRTDIYINESYFKRFPNLKMIIRAGSGVDNVDFEAAARHNVIVCNTPHANVPSAYEHTISMIMALLKNHNNSKEAVMSKEWKDNLRPSWEISDVKALIVGLGRIGSRVAAFLKIHGAEVKAVDPYVDNSRFDELGIEPISYVQGLKWCNLISFHCPLTKNTHYYFSTPILNLLENPVYLLNVARGSIVSEDALEKGLISGMILGAGIDVFEDEPWEVKPFASNPNVLLSPHTGAFTEKAKQRLSEETIEVWKEFVFNNCIKSEVVKWELLTPVR